MSATMKSHECVCGRHDNCKLGYFEGAEALNPFPEAITFCNCSCHSEPLQGGGKDEIR